MQAGTASILDIGNFQKTFLFGLTKVFYEEFSTMAFLGMITVTFPYKPFSKAWLKYKWPFLTQKVFRYRKYKDLK